MSATETTDAGKVLVGLSPAVWQWQPYWNGGRIHERSEWGRPYEHLHHAEQVIRRSTTVFDRIDAITTLKRAIDVRLRWLNTLYGFKAIPVQNRQAVMETCQRFGIFRPLMVAKLHEIRNRVEHQDSEPPNVSECAQLAEFVWYFLKSTDALSSVVPDGFCIDSRGGLYDDPYGLTVDTGPESKWGISVSGWVPGEWVSSDPPPDWMVLERTELVRADELPYKKPGAIGRLAKNSGDDTWIVGRVVDVKGHGDSVFELYFKAD